ncbi:MAG: BadF/BadG/BcrA/BcrD ATPase family protein [Elusimicrobia bacterium]|nr:BadF/BadG/BcrA/BcrD ATPase family protein [Elusimicrobiota bacterium]
MKRRAPRRAFRLGLDLGRTWLRAALADEHGRVLRRARLPARPWTGLPEAMPRLRRRLGFAALDRLTLGCAGLWDPASRYRSRRLLRGWARRVVVVSDVELAHAAAFSGGPGVLVVGGTGSIALARDGSGAARRSGGWGQLLGDEGSGFWIGRRALRDARLRRRLRLDPLKLAREPRAVRATAAAARRILRLARDGDAAARRIRAEAAAHLARLAAEAGRGLRWKGPMPVSWRGGLFADPGLRTAFLRALRRARRRSLPLAPSLDAADAAAVLERIDRIPARG